MLTAGDTGLTVRPNEVVDDAPSSSVAVIVTVCDCSGPSVVANDQLQVPSEFWVTVPTEAVSVTGSCPTSATVPLLLAVCPSLTATVALFTVSTGGKFATATATVLPAAWVPSSSTALALIV